MPKRNQDGEIEKEEEEAQSGPVVVVEVDPIV